MSKVKLPKQWKHWCADSHLKPYTSTSKHPKIAWFYLTGKGFMWRVNMYSEFQRGDKIEDFDRWALCKITSYPMPKTRDEFRSMVDMMVKSY